MESDEMNPCNPKLLYAVGDSEWWVAKDDAAEEMLDAQLDVTAARL